MPISWTVEKKQVTSMFEAVYYKTCELYTTCNHFAKHAVCVLETYIFFSSTGFLSFSHNIKIHQQKTLLSNTTVTRPSNADLWLWWMTQTSFTSLPIHFYSRQEQMESKGCLDHEEKHLKFVMCSEKGNWWGAQYILATAATGSIPTCSHVLHDITIKVLY